MAGGIENFEPVFIPCWGPQPIYGFDTPDEEADRLGASGYYFGPPHKTFFCRASDGTIYEFMGQHIFRESTARACLRNLHTGEHVDCTIHDWDRAMGKNGGWEFANALEVLAWQAE